MPTLLFLLLSLFILLPAARLDTDPCPQGTPVTTPDPNDPAATNPCPTPTPARSTTNLPFASTGNSNLQAGDTPAQTSRNNYLVAAGVTTIVLAVAGFLLFRRPKNRPG